MPNELPSVALVVVLKHLPTGDLVRCRRVNKLWRHLIDHSVSKNELVLFVECHPQVAWWVHRGGEAIRLEEAIQANYGLFESETFFGPFKRVKRMFLSFTNFCFKQEWAEKFVSHFGGALEHLHIDYETTTSLSGPKTYFKLKLPSLQTFCLSYKARYRDFEGPFTFCVDSDRLTHLYATNICPALRSNTILARMAPNLRELFLNKITYEEPIEFPNLQRLGCSTPPSSSFLTACLPSLREFYFPTNFARVQEAAESIAEFVWRIEGEKRNLDVFWLGMKFTKENLVANVNVVSDLYGEPDTYPTSLVDAEALNYFQENRSILNFYHLRYSSQYSIYYCDSFADQLDRNVDRELIGSLRASVYSVFMGELKREFDVPKLADLFQFVSRAVLNNISDRQQVYDKLPTIFPNLRILDYTLIPPEQLDLSFLSRFKYLFSLRVMSPLSLPVLDQILTNCPYLYWFAIFPDDEKFYVVRRRYKHIGKPEKRFDVRFPLFESQAVFFKEKEELFEYLNNNQLALES